MGQAFYAYMLRCSDGSYYVGPADDLQHRLAQHQAGFGSDWTKDRLPVELVWQEVFETRDEARNAEARIKRWNRAKKEALTTGRFEEISMLASRSRGSRAFRDALLRRASPERG